MCATADSCGSNFEILEQKPWRPWEADQVPCGPPEQKPLVVECRACNVTFKRESELRRHRTSKHLKKREKCPMCHLVFTRKDNLTRHLKLAHSNEAKPHCRWCMKSLSRRDAVQRHESTCPKNVTKSSQVTNTNVIIDEVDSSVEVIDEDNHQSHIERLNEKLRKAQLSEYTSPSL